MHVYLDIADLNLYDLSQGERIELLERVLELVDEKDIARVIKDCGIDLLDLHLNVGGKHRSIQESELVESMAQLQEGYLKLSTEDIETIKAIAKKVS